MRSAQRPGHAGAGGARLHGALAVRRGAVAATPLVVCLPCVCATWAVLFSLCWGRRGVGRWGDACCAPACWVWAVRTQLEGGPGRARMTRPPSRGAAASTAPRAPSPRRRSARAARRGDGRRHPVSFAGVRVGGEDRPLSFPPYLGRRKGRKQTGSVANQTPSACMGQEKRSSMSQQEQAIFRHTGGSSGSLGAAEVSTSALPS